MGWGGGKFRYFIVLSRGCGGGYSLVRLSRYVIISPYMLVGNRLVHSVLSCFRYVRNAVALKGVQPLCNTVNNAETIALKHTTPRKQRPITASPTWSFSLLIIRSIVVWWWWGWWWWRALNVFSHLWCCTLYLLILIDAWQEKRTFLYCNQLPKGGLWAGSFSRLIANR